jgi:hypothetical protein
VPASVGSALELLTADRVSPWFIRSLVLSTDVDQTHRSFLCLVLKVRVVYETAHLADVGRCG